MSKILKLRRGLASTMSGAKASTVLAAGEIFAELPNTGVGTGTGKFKMGDGVTPYSQLPYFMEQTDPTTSEITITADSSSTSTAALNNVTSNTALGSLIGSLKQAISLTKSELTQSIDDLNNHVQVGTTHFYFDYHDGMYGYNTSSLRGADTFTPFKSGGGIALVGISTNSSNNIPFDISSYTYTGVENFIIETIGGGEGSSPQLTYNPCFGYVSNTSFNKSISDQTLYVTIQHTVQSAYTDRRSTPRNFSFRVYWIEEPLV